MGQLIKLAASLNIETDRRFYLRPSAEVMIKSPADAASSTTPAKAGAGDGGAALLQVADVHLTFEEEKTVAEQGRESAALMPVVASASTGAGGSVAAWDSALATLFGGSSVRRRPVSDASKYVTSAVKSKFG